ncbi:GNAT family N-acetyltransferase [Microtetraspora sp. NBRC 13810]|uniref:GNAT family N-acetyltransferase n=1 Tax=Microtetraspora sp. NBRC 13810 TaxID=3030990 RepID=UPI002557C286|nr:GNAT family N-acetyltransferase [Microtetraspora sp. NBRC 13810]
MTFRDGGDRALLDRIERFYDGVPRHEARAEDHGPLTLFVRDGSTGEGWPFYARPTLGRPGAATAADVSGVRARQRELGVPESFEWVAEITPALRAAAEEAGLAVHAHPLMALEADDLAPVPAETAAAARVLGPQDPALAAALAVPHLAFAEPGTRIGAAGPAELARVVGEQAGAVPRVAALVRAGHKAVAVAERDGTVLCSGQYNRVGEVCEIVGVGTLPAARRRGLGLAVTAALVAEAARNGVKTVFLSAGDDDVARIYARLGFRPVGTALIAEPR